jgi:hypothetical protein
MQKKMPKEMKMVINTKRKEIENYAYSSGYKIVLNDERIIEMKRFTQVYEYWGLLEGFPRDEEVSGDYELIPEIEKNGFVIYHPKKRWDVYKTLDESFKLYSDSLQNPPVLSPRIRCTAEFESIIVKNRKPRFGSRFSFTCLNIIWYQDNYAFPIEPQVLERIKAIDWDKYSEEFDPC